MAILIVELIDGLIKVLHPLLGLPSGMSRVVHRSGSSGETWTWSLCRVLLRKLIITVGAEEGILKKSRRRDASGSSNLVVFRLSP